MTDKEQIIIGGVDVSKCRFLDVEEDKEDYPEMGGRYTAYECILTSNDCEFSNDCLYKKYQRKTAECEKYEQALEEFELLITNHISSCEKCPDNKNGYCIGIDECSNRSLKKILDIINKAKGE